MGDSVVWLTNSANEKASIELALYGDVAEWSIAAVFKTAGGSAHYVRLSCQAIDSTQFICYFLIQDQ